MSIKSLPGGGGGNDPRLHVSDAQPDSSIVTEGDLWSKTTANELFRATDSSTFVSVETTGSGSMTTVKEAGSQVGGADIEILDFGAGFDIAESPDKEINITLDFTEVTVDPATLILPNGAAPSPTVEADMQWETDRNVLRIGDGAATKEFQPVVDATSDPADVSTAAADGTEDTVARKDHVHNAAEAAITQHEAAIDHDALTNFVAGEHIAEASLDHDALTNFVAGEHQLEAAIDHDALTNFVSLEHVPVTDATSDPVDVADTAADGSEATVARKDHQHAFPDQVVDVWIGAASMRGRVTAGAGDSNGLAERRELATNDVNIDFMAFDAASAEHAYFNVTWPAGWNNGTVKFTLYWTNAAGLTTETIDFDLAAVAFANDNPLDTAFGTAQNVTDTWLAQDDLHITAQSAAITIAGAPAAGEFIVFNLSRDVAADNLTGDCQVLGILLELTRTSIQD